MKYFFNQYPPILTNNHFYKLISIFLDTDMNNKKILLIFCLYLIVGEANCQFQNLKFKQLGTNEGLSQGNVQCIFQDNTGFMWFGTRDGLNKYDGYQFTVYRKLPHLGNSVNSNDIKALQQHGDQLWIGTIQGGVNTLNFQTGIFIHTTDTVKSISPNILNLYKDGKQHIWIGSNKKLYRYNLRDSTFRQYPMGSAVSGITKDYFGNIWVGTSQDGVSVFYPDGRLKLQYSHNGAQKHGLTSDHISFIFEDSKNRLWLGTYGGGLFQFDQKNERFNHIVYSTGNENHQMDFLLCMEEDLSGNLWIGSENAGLFIYRPETAASTTYRHVDNDQQSIGSNTINCIKRDSKGNMWLGTSNAGISMISIDETRFAHFKYEQQQPSLSNNIVNSIFEDSGKRVWIGTDGGGLNLFVPKNKSFKHFSLNQGATNMHSNYVLSISEDVERKLWLGTWGDGVVLFDHTGGQLIHLKNDPADPGSISNNYAFAVYKDHKNRMWVGTYGGGLNLYDPIKRRFTHYVNEANNLKSISGNYILCIQEDRRGRLWIGTDGGGLNMFNELTQDFITYSDKTRLKAGDKLSNNIINSIYADKAGYLWLGTRFGLNRFQPDRLDNKSYFATNGLANDVIGAVLGDPSGYLWISTNKGLSKMDPAKGNFENFTTADGLQADEFRYAKCLDSHGRMYFGGSNGFNVFTPGQIKAVPFDPPIIFTNFQLFNQDVHVGQFKKIVLSHKQSVFSFEFASLNYTANQKKQYVYKLEGYDKTWHMLGTRNNLTYTNLNPGTYLLKVKGLDNERRWSTRTAMVTIVITPPFWKTWWFNTLLFLIVTSIIIGIFYLRLSAVRTRNKLLEKKVAVRTRQLSEQQEHIVMQNKQLESTVSELETSNRAKDKFFSILAHDLKNPIGALSGLANLLKTRLMQLTQAEIGAYAADISRSTESVHHLVINLLDWAKTQSKILQYHPVSLNLHELVMKNVYLAQTQLNAKDISCKVQIDPALTWYADYQMIHTIIRNILGNSIKFTPFSGSITVTATNTDNELVLSIADSGVGMSALQLTQLRSSQAYVSSGTAGETGTGLGLEICQDFIKVHRGSLDIDSMVGKGSVFSIRLPKNEPAGLNHEIAPSTTANIAFDLLTDNFYPLSESQQALLKGKQILIVDDNLDVRSFLKKLLAKVFKILEAGDGREGILAAIEFQPDLIVTDLIMPVMNGLEFCTEAKQNIATSHIPILLLTGETTEESQVSAYEAGADMYLAKPINRKMLFHIIYNFIQNREKMRKKFAVTDQLIPEGLDYNIVDKEFLEKMTTYIEENISRTDLDYKKICEYTAMSRSVLYAKFKTLTGMGVHDYIKNIRLKKSIHLLQEGKLNISQIAYEVGFATPSYFSKSFVKQYQVTPKEYINSLKGKASASTH
ncbi:Signal transduction histidine kinase [bacterium A37T11]|nr:Signal transduction histidine kinase [bacterium A37T11]